MAFGPGLAEEAPPPPIKAPGDPVPVPTVFELIELLQFIRHVRGLAPGERPKGEERFRIALLITAWDSADPRWQREGPHRYLAEHAPLLEDFLWSNFPADDVFRFGLSSTGGDLRNPAYREQYLDNPHGEVFWADTRGEIVRSPDLSVPLCWALFGDQALVPSP